MKDSVIIRKHRKAIAAAMVDRYRTVLESAGRIQYRIYIWEDGEIECLEGPQGDNGYLKAKDYEPRELVYVRTISSPFFDPWDYTDESAPDDEDEREATEQEIIDWLVDEFRNSTDDILDSVIEEVEREEEMYEYR